MQTERVKFESWLQRRRGPKDPNLEADLLVAVAAFDTLQQLGNPRKEELRTLVAGVSSPRTLLYEPLSELMGRLAEGWPEVREEILKMSKSPKAHVRFNAILCLSEATPVSFTDQMLRAGLVDKSARVRWKAADWAGRLRRRELVPELAVALAAEVHPKAAKVLEFELRLLRDGYILKPEEDGSVNVTVRRRNGARGRWISAEEYQAKGIETLVKEMQQE